jgi:hypothetical protein
MPTATVRLASPPEPAATHDLQAALAEIDRRLGSASPSSPTTSRPRR